MNLLDSLLDAIVRLEGDALVMHVGEKPYVVTASASMNNYRGPLAWGQVELSSRVLTPDAVLGMLGQILPLEQRRALEDIGAIEHNVPVAEGSTEQFTVIAARGGDDVWLEVRRHRPAPVVEAVAEPAAAAEPQLQAVDEQPSMATEAAVTPVVDEPLEEEVEVPLERGAVSVPVEAIAPAPAEAETAFEIVEEVAQHAPTNEDVDAMLAAGTDAVMPSPAGAPKGATVQAEEALELRIEDAPEPVFAEEEAERLPKFVEVGDDALQPASQKEPEPQLEVAAEEPERIAEPEPVLVAGESERVAEPEPVLVAEEPERVAEPAPVLVAGKPEPVLASDPVLVADTPEPVAQEPQPGVALEQEPIAEEPRAVVVPLSRSPIHSVSSPQAPVAGSTIEIDELLRVAAARGASAVYVVAQSQPMVRTDGEISALEIGGGGPLTQEDVERIVLELASPSKDTASREPAAEWMCDVAGVGRVRCLTFHDHRGPGVIIRMIPPRAISADQLGLSAEVQALCSQADGLVLVTGARASGKTTLMNAFVDLINRTRSDHVITVEPQIGFVHESRRCFVSQREVRGDAEATVAALRAALREGPDVVFIEDVRTADMATAALQAAEGGRLVFASIASASAPAAVERFLEFVPADRRAQAQASLSSALRGVVSQVLVRRARGGRLAAREVLLNTPPIAGLIQEGRLNQLPRAMEGGRRLGMVVLSDALASLVRDGTVHVTEAYRRAIDKEALIAALKREGVDTSFAERLA